MRLKLSVLGRVQTIACLQKLNTMSCVVHRYGSHSAFKVGTHYRTWSGDKPLRVYCMEFREEISKILGIHCTLQGCPNVLENCNNQKILFHTPHEMFRISNQIFFSWMDSGILFTVKQISLTWNTYRIVSYDLIKLMITQQMSPSVGTACDIIYQDKIEANINMAYGSSTVSWF